MRRCVRVSASMGLMLESASERLSHTGGPHYGSPDKEPMRGASRRSSAAGARAIPFTTGLLIGIGETRAGADRSADWPCAICTGATAHLQEVIIQNFRPKPGARMSRIPRLSLAEHSWTIAVARLILGPDMTIQAPPNLQPTDSLSWCGPA